ncbi:MAG: hypothetical protein U0T82_15765 [Bacteroidales bacterium]
MKRIAVFITLSMAVLAVSAQSSQSRDTIVRMGGKKIITDVINVTSMDVTYKDLKTGDIKSMERKQIEKILYKSGKVDIFNKPVLQMIDDSQWEAVLVTEKKEDVDGMYEYGLITSNASSDARSPKAAKKSATIRLQKKAANMGANVIFVTKAQAKGGYGEIPGYDMEGIAYGFQPPKKTEEGAGKATDIKKPKKK